jgi:hypothetical protein
VRGHFVPTPPWLGGPSSGRCGAYLVRPRTRWHGNLVLRSWASIVARLLGGDVAYRVSAMYVEFANVASPGTPASVPVFDRDPPSGRPYYDGLAVSATNDYLRVPMITTSTTSSDATLYPDGNLITFFAQTSGVAGVNGKPFGEAYNSVVIGGALVAAVVESDPTQDLIFSRFYFDVSEQVPKLDSGQVGLEWELELQ